MKSKRSILLCVALVLSMAMAMGTTLAYLQDSDSDVNVMTLGNVKINQIEKERVTQTNSGTDALRDYTQGKPLFPAVGEVKWVETESGRVYQTWPTGGSSALFDSGLKNVQDKIVFVENTGKSDAYFRTVFAFELAEGWTVDSVRGKNSSVKHMIHLNRNDANEGGGHYEWSWVEDVVEIDGVNYAIATATYVGKDETHANGVLPDGETSRPSLLQLFLDSDAGNEDIASLGDTYDVLVVSQAVQTAGFEATAEKSAAEVALDEAFGVISKTSHPWLDMNAEYDDELDQDPDGVKVPVIVNDLEELRAALKAGGEIILGDDIIVTDSKESDDTLTETAPSLLIVQKDTKLNLNGHTISFTNTDNLPIGAVFHISGATLDVIGEGKIIGNDDGSNDWWPYPIWAGQNGVANLYGGEYGGLTACTIYGSNNGVVNIYGGTYSADYPDPIYQRMLNVYNDHSSYITIYGGTFVNFDFECRNMTNPNDDGGNIVLAEGATYTMTEGEDGNTYRTVTMN